MNAEDLLDAHARALDWTGGVVDGVPHGALGNPTPCAGWDVRQLLNHVVAGNLWVGELAAGRSIAEVGDSLDGDVLGPDFSAAYKRSAETADSTFRSPGAMDAPCAVSYGPVPGHVYCGHRLIDVAVHGWDIAVATGHEAALPEAIVLACQAVLAPQLGALQASGAFGSEVATPEGASPQAVLLASLGRDPSWSR